MRRSRIYTLLAFFLWAFPGLIYSQVTYLGAAADYGTKIREPGFSAIAYYTVNDQIDLAPNFTFYLTHTEDMLNDQNTVRGEKKSSWITINLDGHYNIIQLGILEGFGLMGLNFTNMTVKTHETIQGTDYDDRTNQTKAGLNIGFGGSLHVSNFLTPFAEFKYTLENEASQANARIGLMIRIREDKERETEDW